ncbi:hypothetical protein A0256_23315 [Mucilaginibacter sp. PAMC 26640]|nr:hypothetical protein A0256_23315 [Mucilaginibacter sp. PAMC 26640]
MGKVHLQPENTGLCGQYAVANLIGCTPEESILAFGKPGGNKRKTGTQTKDVAVAIKKLGYYSDERMSLINDKTVLPDLCLIAVGWYGPPIDSGLRRTVAAHWVAYKKGKIICSGYGNCKDLKTYTKKHNGYASGYLEIKKLKNGSSIRK